MRPSTVESIYGKNPVYHVGKVYSLIANTIAQQIGIYFDCEVTIIITTQNGNPLYFPYSIIIETSKAVDKNTVQKIITDQLKKRDWIGRIITEDIFLPENELRHEK